MTFKLLTLANIDDDKLRWLGERIESDAELLAVAPVFTRWMHERLVNEHKRRQNAPDSPAEGLRSRSPGPPRT